jgi:hypothetical protein
VFGDVAEQREVRIFVEPSIFIQRDLRPVVDFDGYLCFEPHSFEAQVKAASTGKK